MRIWLVDFDGKIENLALMRLSAWHKQRGDSVILKRGDARPELFDRPDRVYISCLFRWHRRQALALADAWGDIAEIGGTGVDIAKKLPEQVRTGPLDYDLYGEQRAIGFISRGCIRRCPWCVVPEKEGRLKRVAAAQEIVGNRHQVLFLDNNFLALDGHCNDLLWLADKGIETDFNQGLDARLITEENAQLLARCRWLKPVLGPRLALDSMGMIQSVTRAVTILGNAGIPSHRIFMYVLIGFEGLKSDVERLNMTRDWGVSMFPMGYRDPETGDEPAKEWDYRLYRKYRRLIVRLRNAKSVWDDFHREVVI